MQLLRLRERADFVVLRRAPAARSELFTIQVSREARADASVRVGFTVTKKVGNAVVRNRIKRRLRHATRDSAAIWPVEAEGRDVVVIARITVLDAPYDRLVAEIASGVAKALQPRAKSSRRRPEPVAAP